MEYEMYVIQFTYSPIEDDFPEFEQINVWAKNSKEKDILLSLYGTRRPLGDLMIPKQVLTKKIGKNRRMVFSQETLN